MSLDLEKAARHWSKHTERFCGRNAGVFWWEAGPEIDRHINQCITGHPETDWIDYTLQKHFRGRTPLDRCLSLGCGSGHLERKLVRKQVCRRCDGFDVAEASIQEARRLAHSEGLPIAYHVADVNTLSLPPATYDAVWIHGAMHHFEALEHVSHQIHRSLTSHGLLILQEYVGPNRFQFLERQKEVANLSLQLLPARYRTIVPEALELELERTPLNKGLGWFVRRLFEKARDGDLLGAIWRRAVAYRAKVEGRQSVKSAITFPTARDVISADPTEAIRSAEILPVLEQEFEIADFKGWGGNILQFLLDGIAGRFTAEDPQSQELLKMLLQIERALIHCGEFEPDFAYVVARPLGK